MRPILQPQPLNGSFADPGPSVDVRLGRPSLRLDPDGIPGVPA